MKEANREEVRQMILTANEINANSFKKQYNNIGKHAQSINNNENQIKDLHMKFDAANSTLSRIVKSNNNNNKKIAKAMNSSIECECTAKELQAEINEFHKVATQAIENQEAILERITKVEAQIANNINVNKEMFKAMGQGTRKMIEEMQLKLFKYNGELTMALTELATIKVNRENTYWRRLTCWWNSPPGDTK